MKLKRFIIGSIAAFAIFACQEQTPTSQSNGMARHHANQSVLPLNAPFGTTSDIGYANRLWRVLVTKGIVGPNSIPREPFFGGAEPHGMILEVISQTLPVGKHLGFVIVKKNYDGAGVSVESVKRDRDHYLTSITVMYRREAGYDEDNQNWFWVKYKPDGALFEKMISERRVFLAGRLMKGATRDENRGCIYCHSSAGGGDYVFYPDILVP